MNPFRSALPLLIAASVATSLAAASQTSADVPQLLGPVFNLWLENDLVVRTDQHYTHGSRASWLGSEHVLDDSDIRWDGRIARWLPDFGMRPQTWRFAIAITQNIYTPRDTDIAEIIPTERPYAGWLYLSAALLKRGETAGGTPVIDSWGNTLGMIGPAALGEEAQNGLHRFRSLDLANGWDHQLHNEPDIGFRYSRALRFHAPLKGSFSGQFIPFAGLQAGTIQTFAAIGGQWRVGRNLPDDFGWRTIDDVLPPTGGRPLDGTGHRGFYAFLGIEGRAYAHNSLVEGNLYQKSHSVSLQPLLGEFKLGLVYAGKRWEFAYTHMVRSKEFQQQEDIDSFGSLSVAYKW
jgi:hypothetical protein